MDVGNSMNAWALNPLVKDYFLGPFVGAVMGALFNAYVGSKDSSNHAGGVQPPARTVIETKIVYKQSRNGGNSGSNPELAIAFFVLGAVIYLYAAYAAQIIDAGLQVAYSSATFSVCFLVFSLWRGRVLGYQWLGVFLFSALLPYACTVLLNMAQAGIVPWFADAIAKHGIIGFYVSALSEHGRSYAVTQGLGIAGTSIVLLFSIGWALHYIALVNNFAVAGNAFWSGIVRLTKVFSGVFGVLLSVILLGVSYLLLDGTIMNLWLRK